MNTTYDFGSVMHYGYHAYAKDSYSYVRVTIYPHQKYRTANIDAVTKHIQYNWPHCDIIFLFI